MAEQIKVGVDTGDSLKQLQDMAQAVNDFTQEVAKASGKQVRLLDASKDVAEIKELLKSWREVINAAPTLRGAIRLANEASGKPKDDRPITPMQLDQTLRQNQQWNHATMVRLMTHNASHASTPANTGLSYHDYTGQFRSPPPPPEPVNQPAKNDARFSKIASSAAQGLSSGGVVGGAAASFARGAEKAGDSGLGVMGVLKGGGIAALAYGAYQAVSSAAGAVSDKMDAGKQENIEIDKFKRSLGVTAESFETLKNQSRAVGEQFLLTYEQSRKLTTEFANMAKVNAPGQAGVGVDLAQATGVDESQGVGYMAAMRKSGSLGEKTSDAKLLAIQFAEALKRTGSALNAGELMHAIGGFASSTSQRSLSTPNTEGYAGMLSALVGSGAPGLKGNVGNAAAILGQFDSAFQNGGLMGEASKTLQFHALGGDKVGLMGVKMRQAAGAWASESDVFGNEDSAVNKLLRRNGGRDMTRFNGKQSGIAQVLGQFDGQSMSMDAKIQALGNSYGMNPEQAAAVLLLKETKKLDGMTSLMSQHPELKGKFDSMSGAGYMALSDVQAAGGDAAKLSALRSSFGSRDGLTDEQKGSLSAMAGLTGKPLQDALVKFTTTLEREKTMGEQAQESAAKTAQSTARMADLLIPAAQDAKTLLSDLLSWMAPDSEQGKARKNAARHDAFQTNSGAMDERNAFYDRKRKLVAHVPSEVARINKEQADEMGTYAGQSIRRGPADAQRSSGMGGAEDAIKYFMGKGWTREQAQGIAANFQAESNFDPSAKGDYVGGNPAAIGAMQWHKDRAAKFQQRSGRPLAGSSLHEQYDFFDHELRSGQERVKGARLSKARTASEASSIVVDAVRPFDPDGKKRRNRSATAESYSAIQIPAGNPAGNPGSAQPSSGAAVTGAVTVVVQVESADGFRAKAPDIPPSVVLKQKAQGAQPWRSLVQ